MNTTRQFFAVLCLALPLAASAQIADQRQVSQEQRIEQGTQSGALTSREAARLERGQTHVQNVENKVQADGVVTNQEKARLQHAEGVESRRIYQQKHDRQHDFNHDGRKDRPFRRY